MKILPRRKVWTHHENELTNCLNNYKIKLLIKLVFSIFSFLINQDSHESRKEFTEPFQVHKAMLFQLSQAIFYRLRIKVVVFV